MHHESLFVFNYPTQIGELLSDFKYDLVGLDEPCAQMKRMNIKQWVGQPPILHSLFCAEC